jgi:hypothetical protein
LKGKRGQLTESELAEFLRDYFLILAPDHPIPLSTFGTHPTFDSDISAIVRSDLSDWPRLLKRSDIYSGVVRHVVTQAASALLRILDTDKNGTVSLEEWKRCDWSVILDKMAELLKEDGAAPLVEKGPWYSRAGKCPVKVDAILPYQAHKSFDGCLVFARSKEGALLQIEAGQHYSMRTKHVRFWDEDVARSWIYTLSGSLDLQTGKLVLDMDLVEPPREYGRKFHLEGDVDLKFVPLGGWTAEGTFAIPGQREEAGTWAFEFFHKGAEELHIY